MSETSIPISVPGSTSTDEPQSLDELSADEPLVRICTPCTDPNIIPIYPVRIAFSDLLGDVNENIEYPTSISSYIASRNTVARGGFTLRMLREGYIYIYDESKDIWSIFYYSPNGGETGATESFSKIIWKDGTPDGEWVISKERGLSVAYVPRSAQNIWICYSQHKWSQHTFAKAHKNQGGFRDNVMQKINVLASPAEPMADLLEKIGDYVEDFNTDGITQSIDNWNTLSDLTIKPRKPGTLLESQQVKGPQNAGNTPILIALHDPLGVIAEISMAHLNRIKVKTEYLEKNTYPLTVARAVDTMQSAARTGSSDSRTVEMHAKWRTAVDPSYKTFLDTAEADLEGFEDTCNGIIAAWKKYYNLGKGAASTTPGSLQNLLTTFNPKSMLPREIQDLLDAAANAIQGLSASKAGQQAMRDAIMTMDAWPAPDNLVPQAMRIVTESIKTSATVSQNLRIESEKASNLLADLASPGAFEIVNMNRVDILQTIERFSGGIVNKTMSKVEVPISKIMHEITTGRSRMQQKTKIIQRGHTIHTIQTLTPTYQFEGGINVSGERGYGVIAQNIEGAKSGFILMMNLINMYQLSQTSDRDQATGVFGRLGNLRVSLVLVIAESTTEILHRSLSRLSDIGQRGYWIRGRLSKSVLQKLLTGTTVSDNMLQSIARNSSVERVTNYRVSSAGTALKWISRIGTTISLGLAFVDLLNAAEAHRRGDRMATYSNISLGLGSALIAIGMGTSIMGGWTGFGMLVGVVLIAIGFIYSYFVDDPVTRWLKNSFWGTSDNYLFWDDKSRVSTILTQAGGGNIYEAQVNALNNTSISSRIDYDISRYFQREMQEFYELVYWPQELSMSRLRGLRETGFWPFSTSKLTKTGVKGAEARFRLPNFVDGISEFDGRVIAYIQLEGVSRRLDPRSRMQFIDVTDQFKRNLSIEDAEEGILRSRVQITAPQNANDSIIDDVYWNIERLYMATGWSYVVNNDIALPTNYHDYWIEDGWEIEEIGGQKILPLGF